MPLVVALTTMLVLTAARLPEPVVAVGARAPAFTVLDDRGVSRSSRSSAASSSSSGMKKDARTSRGIIVAARCSSCSATGSPVTWCG